MKAARVTTVLFDLDDTLSDPTHSSLSGLSALRDAYTEFAAFSLEHLAKLASANLERIHLRVLSGELSVEAARTARFRALSRDCGIEITSWAPMRPGFEASGSIGGLPSPALHVAAAIESLLPTEQVVDLLLQG